MGSARSGLWLAIGLFGGGASSYASAPDPGDEHRVLVTVAQQVVVDALRALPDGGSPDWDRQVRGVMVDAFDRDGSGLLDVEAELEPVSCDVWRALDDGVRESWESGLWVTYGLNPGGEWLGPLLGFGEGTAPWVAAALVPCGLSPADAGVSGDTNAIALLPDPGTEAWDEQVGELLMKHDQDASGLLERSEELLAVPCSAWGAIDEGVRARWGSSLWDVYGLEEGESWEADALGVPSRARALLADALKRCALQDQPWGAAEHKGLVSELVALESPGSDSWDRAVAARLVATYDSDGSGSIDTSLEAAAISCEILSTLDTQVRVGWSEGLAVVYGFEPQLNWVGAALGFGDAVRGQMLESLQVCDLAERPMADDASLAVEILGLRGGGTARWDRQVARRLLAAYDVSRDGSLDTAAEIRGVPCEVWRAMDEKVRERWNDGLLRMYGFESGRTWVGYVLAIDGAMRAIAADSVTACLADSAPPDVEETAELELVEQLQALKSAAGTESWELAIRTLLLASYDSDSSGDISLGGELEAMPCPVWGALDESARSGWGAGVLEVYGLGGRGRFHGDRLGLSRRKLRRVRTHIEACL